MATAEYERNVVLSTKEYDVVGTRPVRPDGADKVTGRALYGADFKASGLLHGKVLRSPHAHARIKSIDTSKAEAHPGVLAVVTNKDLPGGVDADVRDLQRNVLAADKALYRGHSIAALAARSPHEAEEAIALHRAQGGAQFRADHHSLVQAGRGVIARALGVDLPHPDDPRMYGSMATIPLPCTADHVPVLFDAIRHQDGIEVPILVWDQRPWVRISGFAGYNQAHQYERLADALRRRLISND